MRGTYSSSRGVPRLMTTNKIACVPEVESGFHCVAVRHVIPIFAKARPLLQSFPPVYSCAVLLRPKGETRCRKHSCACEHQCLSKLGALSAIPCVPDRSECDIPTQVLAVHGFLLFGPFDHCGETLTVFLTGSGRLGFVFFTVFSS